MQRQLYELTQAGQVVAVHDLSSLGLLAPQGLVFAPSADPTDDPAILNLYVADSGLSGAEPVPGGIVELSLMAAPALIPGIPVVPATLERITDMSQYSIPSTDPAGIAYLPDTGRLMISDSEIEESPAPYWHGVNVWETTLSGNPINTYSTRAFSSEPTGVAYNRTNRHLFFSDDDRARVNELNPGSDGLYNTSDDILTWFGDQRSGVPGCGRHRLR